MAWNQWCTCRTNIQLVDENDSFKWNLHQTIHLFVESMYETLMQFDVPIQNAIMETENSFLKRGFPFVIRGTSFEDFG